jgi:thiol-disulfide isomerase/thioredoxin
MSRLAQTGLFLGVALVAALAGFALSPLSQAPAVDAKVLLETSLPDLEGQRRQVADWRGKVLVVNFWATWCAPCLEEIPLFVRMQERLGPEGLQFVGIAVDREASVREFARAKRMNYPVLIGHAGAIELSRLAGNARGGLPYTVVLDREARPIRVFEGGLTEAQLAPILTKALRR